ncbi:MAG: hypothetical protein MPEBLZ_03318 [Candidatus Methanoperedens nitroreducens]|uniref:Pvc16 N-terminal domain-containing protein n=1 Tax=Candidatus Methanoperedens nitratireducens TaxID=1392998 RepID=A0A0N8KQH4_9EURY|nr:DUF4255 domain-containing protein [Candidatus Methanoperedens sp. BLZ2]KAB2944607.1 MAG: DUF4255 domain-containing protein [Candidatus Methanoperedens sp.]KPQ42146.1 MAG: hypothetical protein MPEBLZ_03318 [Candidatus Methanoperedens sp. BLZ1]MBZ0176874.1 DUF4255 domain-containing protein [Candidatus Methanoperedens nitroreducens]CAG0986292.1 hypothetical protein METP2_02296 [Methanosarcinales archaeon]MCX9077106.1 DUF4255 domain-containing protein [Candidatus Methanoperedens sp.]
MAGNTAIKDVGNTLISLLIDNMKDLPDGSIVLGSPGEIKSDTRISLFLYKIQDNIHLKNQEMQQVGSSSMRFPPLALDLFYMLTSHPSQENTEKTLEAHLLLGRAMQVFYDNAILSGSVLKGSLKPGNEELRITIENLNIDDMTKIWSTFQGKPFKPTACYLVSPVRIDSLHEISITRVVSKEAGYDEIVLKRRNE